MWGPLWPGQPWTASLFPQGKSYDHQNSWLCFCLCLNGPMKVIFGVCFQNFWKTEKNFFDDFDIKGSPLWKKNRKYQKKFFFGKNHTFSFWICIVHVLSFLLMYRVRHMSWYGVSNGHGTKIASARSSKIFTAIYYSLWQLFWKFGSLITKEFSFMVLDLTKN